MPNDSVFNSQADPLHTELTDGTDSLSIQDNAAVAIDFVHAEIHEGDHYTTTKFFQAVANNAYADLHITTGATKYAHTIMTVQSEAKSYVSIYRNCTYSAIGTTQPIYNNNENSLNTTEAAAYFTPTINVLGTLIFQDFVTAAKGQNSLGANLTSRNERILKLNTDYLIRIQNVGGSSVTSDTSISISYYEL